MSDIPDVDLEVMHREDVVELFPTVIPASQITHDARQVKHISGIYFQNIPINPLTKLAVFPYEEAEDLGFYKIDLLSCPNPYDGIESMDELQALLDQPIQWDWFHDTGFVSSLFHFNGTVHQDLSMAEVVAYYAPQSIEDLAMLVAIKLPPKKHLIGEDWATIRAEIWKPEPDRDGKPFKKSHSIAYALVAALDARRKATTYFGKP